jgi:hypothetical protein
MVTNMGLFKIFYISILFFNASLFAGLNTIEQNDLIIKKNEDSLIEKYDSNQKILIDSLVYPFEQEASLEGFEKLGNFHYKLNSTENSDEYLNDVNEDRKIFKLVEIGNGKYMIADGSFIIEFQGNTDRQKFNEEYSIIPKYEMGTRTAYQPLRFENLDGVLKRLNVDNRVISFELDLIDPNIVLQ